MAGRIILKPGRDKPVLAHHPWIFSGAIARAIDASEGDTVEIFDAGEHWLARGYYNPSSQIAVRIWTWRREEEIDRAWLRRRLEHARAMRETFVDPAESNAYRVVNAESDWLPGLIVDRYADFLTVQFLTLGIEKWKADLVELLEEMFRPQGIYNRSDVDVREKEGLTQQVELLAGAAPPEEVEIREDGLRFLVDVKQGHKTGFYLDQRENRRRAARYLGSLNATRLEAKPQGLGPLVLNVFSYTGAFGVYACRENAGTRVVNLDASEEALRLARENMRINGLEMHGEYVQGDAFQLLRRYRDERRTFDAIILDPPKFVYSHSQLTSGLRGYKDINLLAFKLLNPGGLLVTFSCSGLVNADLFQKVVFEAAVDAGRDAQIMAKLLQAPDHPILLSFPESEYLKGLLCRVPDF